MSIRRTSRASGNARCWPIKTATTMVGTRRPPTRGQRKDLQCIKIQCKQQDYQQASSKMPRQLCQQRQSMRQRKSTKSLRGNSNSAWTPMGSLSSCQPSPQMTGHSMRLSSEAYFSLRHPLRHTQAITSTQRAFRHLCAKNSSARNQLAKVQDTRRSVSASSWPSVGITLCFLR